MGALHSFCLKDILLSFPGRKKQGANGGGGSLTGIRFKDKAVFNTTELSRGIHLDIKYQIDLHK